ncbi:hypothetical protein BS17DRAFT_823448 [Gyrodon lividus]|nr:hypothetical protein BS17DRAFT_823448 [Gyrodon lividus]
MDIHMDLAEQLLGKDAYIDGRKALTKPVSKFINTLMTISWNQFCKVVNTEVLKMDKLVEAIKMELARISVEGYKPSTAELLALLKNIHPATMLLFKYTNKQTLSKLETFKEQLEGLLAAVQRDTSSEATKKLPKSVVDALSQLASANEIAGITIIIHASLENLNVDITERVIIEVDNNIDISNWSEGVKDLNTLTTNKLWERLGLSQKQLPFFQEWSNPDLVVDAWSNEGQQSLKDANLGRQPLIPRWHQLVGIYRMLERVFEDKPLLLMDGVGLGTTLQAVGAIACMAYYWECLRMSAQFAF